jgi:hypothetical protein
LKILDMTEIEKKILRGVCQVVWQEQIFHSWSDEEQRKISSLYCLLRIRLKRQNPIVSYCERERERERVHSKCTMYCTVQFIISLFNVGNVLVCAIYQLNFTVFMYVTWISRYMTSYIAFGVIRCFM